MGRCVFPLYHSVMAAPRGRADLRVVGEGAASPTAVFFGAVYRLLSRIGQAVPLAASSVAVVQALLWDLLRNKGVASTDSSHQAMPRIQPSISATFRSGSVKLALKNRSRVPSRSFRRSHSAMA